MPTDHEIDVKNLKYEMEIFYEKVGLDLQYHDKGGEAKTLHWSDPENKKNQYHMDSITSEYFTTLEAVKALQLVNAVLEKITEGKIFYESKKCLNCGKPSKDREFCSENCLNEHLSKLGTPEEIKRLQEIGNNKETSSL